MADGEALRIDERLTIPAGDLSERFIRAGGPGGQHVNKVATGVQLRFAASRCDVLAPPVRKRLFALASHLVTKEGDLLLEASSHRSQERNRQEARGRLAGLLREAAKPPPPPRKKTRPTRGSVERRLHAKKARGQKKSMRGRVQD